MDVRRRQDTVTTRETRASTLHTCGRGEDAAQEHGLMDENREQTLAGECRLAVIWNDWSI